MLGELLVEDYPDLTALSKLDVAGLDIRRELSEGRLELGEVVAFMVELSDAVAYIHRHGFVHRDVRSTNVFVRREDGRLIPTLFDYDLITRPFFLAEAEIHVDLEAPPEVRVGHVLIDGRFDVYQLGWMLRKLTHYEAAPDIWTPVAPLSERLRAIIGCATGPFGEQLSRRRGTRGSTPCRPQCLVTCRSRQRSGREAERVNVRQRANDDVGSPSCSTNAVC